MHRLWLISPDVSLWALAPGFTKREDNRIRTGWVEGQFYFRNTEDGQAKKSFFHVALLLMYCMYRHACMYCMYRFTEHVQMCSQCVCGFVHIHRICACMCTVLSLLSSSIHSTLHTNVTRTEQASNINYHSAQNVFSISSQFIWGDCISNTK